MSRRDGRGDQANEGGGHPVGFSHGTAGDPRFAPQQHQHPSRTPASVYGSGYSGAGDPYGGAQQVPGQQHGGTRPGYPQHGQSVQGGAGMPRQPTQPEHGHVQGQRASSGADPTVLWEDTKKWVDQIRKATPDKQKFLQYLQIDEQSLEAWYTGRSALPQTTTKLRQQIKLYMDKQKQRSAGQQQQRHAQPSSQGLHPPNAGHATPGMHVQGAARYTGSALQQQHLQHGGNPSMAQPQYAGPGAGALGGHAGRDPGMTGGVYPGGVPGQQRWQASSQGVGGSHPLPHQVQPNIAHHPNTGLGAQQTAGGSKGVSADMVAAGYGGQGVGGMPGAQTAEAPQNLTHAVPAPDQLKPVPAVNLPVEFKTVAIPASLRVASFGPKPHVSQELIPIRLNLTCEGQTLRDTFLWNYGSKDARMTPEHFAKQLCDETDLPAGMQILVLKAMNDQIAEYRDLEKHGDWTKKVDEVSYGCSGELLVKITLDLRVNDFVLQDAFIWDLKQSGNCPETFATSYVDDLQLPSELVATVAHAIREQVHTAKAKILRGNDDAALLKSIRTRWRESDKPTWSPSCWWLQHGEREQYERNAKKQRLYAQKAQGVRAAMPMMTPAAVPVARK